MRLESHSVPAVQCGLNRRIVGLAAAALLASTLAAPAQETLSEEEKARLAASDVVIGEEVVLPEVRLPFNDTFDGRELAEDWTVVNENQDKYVPNGGAIFALQSGGKAHPATAETDNIFLVNGIMPDTDFDMTASLTLDAKTGYEDVWVGLWADADNYLAANLNVYTKGCGASLYLRVENRRSLAEGEKPDVTSFTDNLLDGPIIDGICSKGPRAVGDEIIANLGQTAFKLTLSRRGFRYFATIALEVPPHGDNAGGLQQVSTYSVSRVRPFGQPFFMLGQSRKAGSGETSALFEDFTIVAVE